MPLTFLTLVENRGTRMILADLIRVRVHLPATLMDTFLGHVGYLVNLDTTLAILLTKVDIIK